MAIAGELIMIAFMSFAVAALTLIVSVLAFVVGNKDNPGLRYGVGGLLLLAAFAFSIVGAFAFLGSDDLSTRPIPLPIVQPTQAESKPVIVVVTPTTRQSTSPPASNQAPNAYRDEGFKYHQSGQYDKAIATFKICIEAYPSYGDCYNGLGMASREIGDFQQALPNHDKAIAISPRFDFYFERGVTYHQEAEYDKAILDLTICLEKNPGFGNCFVRLGMAYRDIGKFQQALIYHHKGIELSPDRADFYWERGVTYERMGNSAQAESDKKKARELGYRQ